MAEIFFIHTDLSKTKILEECRNLLNIVGINNIDVVLKSYPHQLSGGMRQRVMIAMALSLKPKILIADEPTTALDVTIQAQVLSLINKIKEEYKMSVIFITHDMGVVYNMCNNVAVMYAGRIVEKASTEDIFNHPMHPYTKGLLNSVNRSLDKHKEKLQTIEGLVPSMFSKMNACRFQARCSNSIENCKLVDPDLILLKNRELACINPI
jgi:oligopeptide/dipeptide ABC transporter ATP-binding protein